MSIRTTWVIFIGAHLAPAAAAFAWGWQTGLAIMVCGHLALVALILIPCGPFASRALKTFATGGRDVCLTIDDGPAADTVAILDLLAAHDAKAVFFLIGGRAARRPEDVNEIHRAGHLIANHTQHHAAAWHWCFGPGRQLAEIAQCQDTLGAITGIRPAWFRPPAGFANPFTPAVLRESGLRCAGWSVRGQDGTDRDADRILRRLIRGVHPGTILLVHQGLPHHLEVLPRLLAWLTENGWRIVLPREFTAGGDIPPASC